MDVLSKAGFELDNCRVNTCYAITEDCDGKSFRKIDDVQNYSVFEDYLSKDSEGNWDTSGMSRSVMVFIAFVEDEKEGYVGMHMNPWGHRGEDMSIMARLSIVKMMEDDETAGAGKSLVIFDIRGPKEEMEKIEYLRKLAVEKLRNGNELEKLEAWSIILIDQERIPEAREYFTGLLDDPDCVEFAKGELKYISENFPIL